MRRRTFEEMITYFNQTVSEMDIDTNYKMELLGMVTALGFAHEKETKERKTGRWIPCSERLPEEGQIVLATHLGGINPNRQVIEHIYSGGEFLSNWDMDMEFSSPTFGERYMGAVVAWMPLPEPYREGEG